MGQGQRLHNENENKGKGREPGDKARTYMYTVHVVGLPLLVNCICSCIQEGIKWIRACNSMHSAGLLALFSGL